MNLNSDCAEIFVPDNWQPKEALGRTTHLAIGAHHDDLEIMAAGPILECFQQPERWFTGVVVTDGGGSPRSGLYERYTDEEMQAARAKEQRKAGVIGEYAALALLNYPSKAVKDPTNRQPVEDLAALLQAARPEYVYTHNLADKHDTHVGVAVKVIAAIRSLPVSERPQRLYGCEVWRDLDWMVDGDKVTFDLSNHENLQAALLGVFDSQIAGGKRYDLASMARRRANATYFESHGVDETSSMSFAMELTPLILHTDLDVEGYVREFIQRFLEDVTERLKRVK
jgi:LmbE family N-acetylglucosaminyl deacetylase